MRKQLSLLSNQIDFVSQHRITQFRSLSNQSFPTLLKQNIAELSVKQRRMMTSIIGKDNKLNTEYENIISTPYHDNENKLLSDFTVLVNQGFNFKNFADSHEVISVLTQSLIQDNGIVKVLKIQELITFVDNLSKSSCEFDDLSPQLQDNILQIVHKILELHMSSLPTDNNSFLSFNAFVIAISSINIDLSRDMMVFLFDSVIYHMENLIKLEDCPIEAISLPFLASLSNVTKRSFELQNLTNIQSSTSFDSKLKVTNPINFIETFVSGIYPGAPSLHRLLYAYATSITDLFQEPSTEEAVRLIRVINILGMSLQKNTPLLLKLVDIFESHINDPPYEPSTLTPPPSITPSSDLSLLMTQLLVRQTAISYSKDISHTLQNLLEGYYNSKHISARDFEDKVGKIHKYLQKSNLDLSNEKTNSSSLVYMTLNPLVLYLQTEIRNELKKLKDVKSGFLADRYDDIHDLFNKLVNVQNLCYYHTDLDTFSVSIGPDLIEYNMHVFTRFLPQLRPDNIALFEILSKTNLNFSNLPKVPQCFLIDILHSTLRKYIENCSFTREDLMFPIPQLLKYVSKMKMQLPDFVFVILCDATSVYLSQLIQSSENVETKYIRKITKFDKNGILSSLANIAEKSFELSKNNNFRGFGKNSTSTELDFIGSEEVSRYLAEIYPEAATLQSCLSDACLLSLGNMDLKNKSFFNITHAVMLIKHLMVLGVPLRPHLPLWQEVEIVFMPEISLSEVMSKVFKNNLNEQRIEKISQIIIPVRNFVELSVHLFDESKLNKRWNDIKDEHLKKSIIAFLMKYILVDEMSNKNGFFHPIAFFLIKTRFLQFLADLGWAEFDMTAKLSENPEMYKSRDLPSEMVQFLYNAYFRSNIVLMKNDVIQNAKIFQQCCVIVHRMFDCSVRNLHLSNSAKRDFVDIVTIGLKNALNMSDEDLLKFSLEKFFNALAFIKLCLPKSTFGLVLQLLEKRITLVLALPTPEEIAVHVKAYTGTKEKDTRHRTYKRLLEITLSSRGLVSSEAYLSQYVDSAYPRARELSTLLSEFYVVSKSTCPNLSAKLDDGEYTLKKLFKFHKFRNRPATGAEGEAPEEILGDK